MHLFGYLREIIIFGMTTCCAHDYSGMNMRERKCPVQISAGININTSKRKPRTKKKIIETPKQGWSYPNTRSTVAESEHHQTSK